MSEAQLPAQLSLAFGHAPQMSEGDFLVAPCNADALAWLRAWETWPGPASILYGPAGSGKTHLAHLFARAAVARLIPARELSVEAPPRLLAEAPALVLEDCDRPGLDETALFHLINLAKEIGRRLLLTGRAAPSLWPVGLPDLRSRLLAMPAMSIGAPDDALLAAVLVKLFADRQLRIGADVIPYLLGRMERSFEACTRLVERLDHTALAGQRAITVPLARRVLDGEDENGSGTEGP